MTPSTGESPRDAATQAIGRLRTQIRRYLCRQAAPEALAELFRELRLAIELTPHGYTFRVPLPPAPLTPAQEESVAGLPALYAVEPPQRTPEAIVLTGSDVECLPGILTELTGVGLLAIPLASSPNL